VGDSPIKQQVLKNTRSGAFASKQRTQRLDEDPAPCSYENRELLASDPFGFLAESQSQWLECLKDCQDTTWMSDFQHRMIILVATFTHVHHATQAVPVTDGQGRESVRLTIHATTEVEKFAGEVIRVSHPREADSILEDYLPNVISSAGLCMVREDGQNLVWNRVTDQ